MAKVLIGNFKGPKGDQGVKGDPGTAASIQVGTTQTVQPEENAEVNNTGTTSAAVLNFKIPRGADGMTDLTAEYSDASEYTCEPTVNAPVVVKGVDGKTEQVETTGAQLLDKSTATANSYISNTTGGLMSGNESYASDYIPVSGMQNIICTNTQTQIWMAFYDSEKAFVSGSSGYGVPITVPENASFARFTVKNDYIDTFMVNSGDSLLPYEPYTGGQPAPSPDYPQVIKGVGGMGYFDGEWVQGNISSTGAIGTETTGITSANVIPCKQNDNIAVTYEDSIDVIAVAFYNASGAYISTSTSGNSVDTFTATAPANAASFKVNLRVVSGSTITANGAK